MAYETSSFAICCARRRRVVYRGMNLPLDIVRTTGRAQNAPPSADFVRPLTEADLVLLAEEKGSVPPPVKRIRDRHHALARILASGKSEGEAAAITGYDISRVSILKNDPAFRELLAFYRDNVEAEYLSLHEQLAGIATDAAILLREKIEEEPEKLSVGQLLELTKMGADRTGHGPAQKVEHNVNVNLANRLEQARERVKNRTIDITPNQEAAE